MCLYLYPESPLDPSGEGWTWSRKPVATRGRAIRSLSVEWVSSQSGQEYGEVDIERTGRGLSLTQE